MKYAMAQDQGNSPELRGSDAERDAVVSELGQHFQDGRLGARVRGGRRQWR